MTKEELAKAQFQWACEYKKTGCQKTLKKLVKSLEGLAVRQALTVRGSGVEHEELKSAGMVGVVRAINTFDAEKENCSISGFARVLIKEEVFNLIQASQKYSSKNSRLDRRLHTRGMKMFKELKAQGVSQDEIMHRVAVEVETSVERVTSFFATHCNASFVAVDSDDVHEQTASQAAFGEQEHTQNAMGDVVRVIVEEANLNEREVEILKNRSLCDKDDWMSLDDLGAILGISRERVRKLEIAMFEKLRLVVQSRGLQMSDFV